MAKQTVKAAVKKVSRAKFKHTTQGSSVNSRVKPGKKSYRGQGR